MARDLMGKRDKDVYAWERQCVFPHDHAHMDEHVMRSVALHVWKDMGLLNPPLFRINPNVRGGHATRQEVVLQTGPNHALLFHEMAHAMDMSIEMSVGATALRPKGEESGSCHDENWLGLYVEMLDRYLGGPHFNKFWLYKSLKDHGLAVSYGPRPRCI